MRQVWSVLGTLVFLVLAPGSIAVLVPWLLTGWHTAPALLGVDATLAVGAALLSAGLLILLESFTRFALEGLGTPAPVFPTQKLVVGGLYRFLRNPMYLAILCLVLGESLLLASPILLAYAVILAAAFHLFVRFYEEPTLRRTYGDEYETYCAEVGRWIPRRSRRPASAASA